jgi:peptide deformylase
MITVTTDRKILSVVSSETTMEEIIQLDLVAKLKEACESAWTGGVGLSAIQIGIPIRAAWYKWQGKDEILINPKVVRVVMRPKMVAESCLSIPNRKFAVKRAIKIKYMNDGKMRTARGLRAQIIQHEIDHMNGILVSDRAESEVR